MSYEKTVWQSGDVITAEKLNKIEDALAAMLNGATDAPQGGGEVEHSVSPNEDTGK